MIVATRPSAWHRIADFVTKEVLSCAFPFCFFAVLGASKLIHIPGLARYDFILLGALAIQAAMLLTKVETVDEAKTIALFHILGLGMEIYKVGAGSWAYPETALTKVAGVPLYSGFMYASVGSYVCQAWRRLDLKLNTWPPAWQVVALGLALYVNFFTHHFIPDLRVPLCVVVVYVFRDVWIDFQVAGETRTMPLVISFLLIGSSLWIAENAATYLGAWQYPYQREGWRLVDMGKISSWSMLVIVSVILVAHLKHVKTSLGRVEPSPLP